MISKRTKVSLCEFLWRQPSPHLRVLLEKHDIWDMNEDFLSLDYLVTAILDARPEELRNLIAEVLWTQRDLRTNVDPKYSYDDRWRDLTHCLLLDGYRVEEDQLVAVDPTVEGAEPLDDDLTRLLKVSGLQEATDIIASLNASTDAFRRVTPDVNACLTNARIALETAAKAIARRRQHSFSMGYDESKWGSALEYLRKSDFITKREEEGLAGVYTFTSEGAHSPLGADEVEMARLGRSFIIGMLYFLVKRFAETG